MTDLERALAAGGKVAAPPAGSDLEKALAAGGKPVEASAAPEGQSFLGEATKRAGDFLSSFTNPVSMRDVGQSFKDLAGTVAGASGAVGHAVAHPVETFQGSPAARALGVSTPEAVARNQAEQREVMRGVNSNIPLANLAVEHLGGPSETSATDAAAAPGAQALGQLAGIPVANMEGEIAAKAAGAAVPAISKVVRKAGAAADERGVARALDELEERTNKRARAGVQSDAVEDLVREEPKIAKAAGNDAKLAKQVGMVREKASANLGRIYSEAAPEIDMATPIMKMDVKIADLMKGTSEDAEIGRQLQKVRDELNDRIGSRDSVTPRELRDEQTAYQKKGYGKAMPGDEAGSARIAANREASKAVGDAVLEHVTGLDYTAARAAAEAEPNSLAGRLLKANDRVNAANKLEAAIADRAAKVQPAKGPLAALKRMAGHAALPVLAGATHGPGAAIAAAVGQEALHAAPGLARGAVSAIDRGIVAGAPTAAGAVDAVGGTAAGAARVAPFGGARHVDLLEQLIARADAGDSSAAEKLAALSRAPIVAARIGALRRKRQVMQ